MVKLFSAAVVAIAISAVMTGAPARVTGIAQSITGIGATASAADVHGSALRFAEQESDHPITNRDTQRPT